MSNEQMLSSFAVANTKADEGIPCLYDPDEDGCELVLYIKPVKPREITKMTDDARGRRNQVNTGKFNEALCQRSVRGWENMTVDEAIKLGIFYFEDGGEAARKVWPDGIPYSQAQALNFMNESIDFAGRVNELASETAVLKRATAAYQGKASGSGPATGD